MVRSYAVKVLLALLLALLTASAPLRADERSETLERVRAAIAEGRFAEAERICRAHLPDADAPITDEFATALEVMRRIKLDFPLDETDVLQQLRARLGEVSAAEVERWRKAGVLQHRVIDGEVRYFYRAVGNLLRWDGEARRRAQSSVAPAGAGFDLPEHLARVLEEAEDSKSALVHPVRHRVRYELSIKPGNPRVKPGARVRCWLPYPQEYRQQQEVRLLSSSPAGALVAAPEQAQRTIYFEQTIDDAERPPKFVAEYEFITHAYCPDLDPVRVEPYDKSSDLYQAYTAERLPHIKFTPELRAQVERIVAGESNPLRRAQRIFRWVSEHVPWCAEMEYSTIPSLSEKGFRARRGDCGVQGMVFITMCRAAGVPARWQSGWQTQPDNWNMHDWSEFYVEPWGWLPADASYGVQRHADPRVQMFLCGHLDPYRMIVNLDYGRELHPPKTSFRSEPNDFQRGEIEIDGHNLYFDEWRWKFDVQTLPLTRDLGAVREALDAVMIDTLGANDVPGAVILVGRKRDEQYEIWQKAYGYMQVQPERAPMPSNAIFDLASMTKPIAAGTSVMLLVQDDQIGLDDPVAKYLPEFDSPDKRAITIRHLMTHTSGLPPYVGKKRRDELIARVGWPCVEEARALLRNVEPRHAPGEKTVYSCLNAIMCGEIVREVSGQPLDAFARERIFTPLRMEHTMFTPPARLHSRTVPTTCSNRPGVDGKFLRGQVHDPLAAMLGGVSGNAGLFSNTNDLSRFAQMLLNGGELDGVRLLEPDTIALLTSVQNRGIPNKDGDENPRGLLWDLYPNEDGTIIAFGHTGYTGGALRVYPDDGYYVIAMTNRVHPDDSGKVGPVRNTIWNTVRAALRGEPIGW